MVRFAQRRDLCINHGFRLAGKHRPLEQHPVDFLAQRADAPLLQTAHLGIELTFQAVFDREKLFEVRPAQLSRQCMDNWEIGKYLRKLYHVEQVWYVRNLVQTPLSIVATVSQQFVPVGCAFFLQNVAANVVADMPVHQRQFAVDGDGGAFPRLIDQAAQIAEQCGYVWCIARRQRS